MRNRTGWIFNIGKPERPKKNWTFSNVSERSTIYLKMRIEKDFKEFIGLLNSNKVKYLVVGGFAFSYYAEPRFTKDIDFLVEPSLENAQKLMHALAAFGFGDIGLKAEDFTETGQVIQLGNAPLRIDIATSITGVPFEAAWENKVLGNYHTEPCFFIGKKELLKNKQALGRPQDIADVHKLKNI